jgi:hypothetical protein
MNINYFNNLSTGFHQMGEAIKDKLVDIHFTGLKDTPTGYSGGYYLQSTEGGIRYVSPTGLANDIGDEIVKTIVTGKLFDFTGLGDTPTGYSGGYYLQSTENGIRYVSSTGLADDIGDEIVKTIVTGKLFDFTGLGDTPADYSGGYYLQSTENGIRYISSTGLAENISKEVTKTIVTGKLFDFTGLGDTPADYSGGYYLQSTENGIRYVSSTGLADDIGDEIVKTIVTGKLFDFTGLGDTPADYSGGYYLQSTENGIRYISSTGLAENISKEVTKTIVTGKLFDFTGLGDTPSGYKAYADKFFVVPSGDRLVYDTVRFLENVSDAPTNQLVDGYLKLVQQGSDLVLQWSAGTTAGTVNYNIDGATHFTGLFDTPTGYKRGYYVRVKEDQDKLEYISSTGLAEDISKEVTKTIVTGKLFDFTGLGDTPADYSGGYYLQSTENGIRYISSTGLAENISKEVTKTIVTGKLFDFTGLGDTPADYSGGYYLQSTENGIRYISSTGLAENISKEVTKTIVTGKLFDFTGLGDTPTGYESGYYLRSTTTGIEYISSTGLSDDIIAGMTGIGGTVLKIKDTGTGIEFVEMDELEAGAKAFTGLSDTPADYSGGYYLQSTENGIRYISSTGLAENISKEVTKTIVTGKLFDFTGLGDTPADYSGGYYLQSTENGIRYISATGLSDDIIAGMTGIGGTVLKIKDTGTGIEFVEMGELEAGAKAFTGLSDTPADYSGGYYLQSTENGIRYISSTGLANDIGDEITQTIITGQLLAFTGLSDTPDVYYDGFYVRSTNSNIEYFTPGEVAVDLGDDIVRNIITGKLFDFTGLADTPAFYKSGYYTRSTSTGIEYISSTGLAEDISKEVTKTIVTGKLFDFTGLGDTPTGYSGGYYLQSTENGIRYISPTGLANDIGEEIVKTIVTGKLFDFTGLGDTPSGYKAYSDKFFVVPSGDRLVYDKVKFLENVSDAPISVIDGGFLKVTQDHFDDPFRLEWAQPESVDHFTGLVDTPTDYESYTDGFFVVPSGDRLVYDTVRFLDNVSDAPENQLVDGYLKLVEQDGNLVLQWSAGTTNGDVTYNIDGATHFTGLFDTPTGYKRGYYVRVKDGQDKLEYISSTGLAEDTASEIANVIAHEKLLDFTGLGDTPTGYKSHTDGFFVVPSGDRLVYDKVKFLENVSDAPSIVVDGGFLKVTQDHFDDPFRLEWVQPESINNFTGLSDTPANYSGGYYVQSTDNGIRYISSTGLAQDISAEVSKTIVSDKLLDLTGLADTPNDYLDGQFLQATDDGFSYISTDDLADELDDKIVQNIVDQKLLDFTGLGDTPANYKLGQYLRSTDIGIEYITSHEAATDLGSIPKQYREGFDYEGQIVNSGCDLYFVCDGNWEKLSSYDGKLDLDTQDIPACVDTVEELAVYEIYKENFVSENMNSVFDFQLQDDLSTVNNVYNVCLFSSDSNSKVAIQETSYRWGMFNGSQTINLRALPGQNAGFSHWTGYGASFSDPLDASASVLVDKDLSITGVFNADPQFNGTFNLTPNDNQYTWDYRLMTDNAYQYELFGFATALDGDMMVVGSINGSSASFTSGGSRYANGRGTVRLHTFKKDSSTNNMFVEVAVQHEPFLNDSGSGFKDFMYGSAMDMDGGRLVRILDHYPFFRSSLGHNVDPELAALVDDIDAVQVGFKDYNKCGAVEVLKWTGTRWAREAMLFPKMRDRNTGDLLADYETFGANGPSQVFAPVSSKLNYVTISGGRIYVSTRQKGIGAMFELQNNGEWIQTDTINWGNAIQTFSASSSIGFCPMFVGDYMLVGHNDNGNTLGLYKKNGQGIMEAVGSFYLGSDKAHAFRYKNGILMQGCSEDIHCSNCTSARPDDAYARIFSFDINNLSMQLIGEIDPRYQINARNLPSMGNAYWSCLSCLGPNMSTNGEIFTIGWGWDGSNNFYRAGNVFVYTRS